MTPPTRPPQRADSISRAPRRHSHPFPSIPPPSFPRTREPRGGAGQRGTPPTPRPPIWPSRQRPRGGGNPEVGRPSVAHHPPPHHPRDPTTFPCVAVAPATRHRPIARTLQIPYHPSNTPTLGEPCPTDTPHPPAATPQPSPAWPSHQRPPPNKQSEKQPPILPPFRPLPASPFREKNNSQPKCEGQLNSLPRQDLVAPAMKLVEPPAVRREPSPNGQLQPTVGGGIRGAGPCSGPRRLTTLRRKPSTEQRERGQL